MYEDYSYGVLLFMYEDYSYTISLMDVYSNLFFLSFSSDLPKYYYIIFFTGNNLTI